MINYDSLKQKASEWFISLTALEATFSVGVKTKHPARNSTCIWEIPVKVRCAEFAPADKKS